MSICFACRATHGQTRPYEQCKWKPKARRDLLDNQRMRNLADTATGCKHGKQDAVLVSLKSKGLFQPRDIGVGERRSIKVVEKVGCTTIHLGQNQSWSHILRRIPNQNEAIYCLLDTRCRDASSVDVPSLRTRRLSRSAIVSRRVYAARPW